jgi:hypothetical protein
MAPGAASVAETACLSLKGLQLSSCTFGCSSTRQTISLPQKGAMASRWRKLALPALHCISTPPYPSKNVISAASFLNPLERGSRAHGRSLLSSFLGDGVNKASGPRWDDAKQVRRFTGTPCQVSANAAVVVEESARKEEENAAPLQRSGAYPFKELETKWQRFWEEKKTFRTPEEVDTSKPKFYALDMFPYPRYEPRMQW